MNQEDDFTYEDVEQPKQEVEVYEAPAKVLMLAQELPDLDAMQVGENIAMQYLQFRQGEAIRAIFAGMTTITSNKNLQGGESPRVLPSVVLQTKDGLFLNSGASLVNQLRNVPGGTPIQVTFTGKEKTTGGNNVNKFEVRLLKLGMAHVSNTMTREQAGEVLTPAKAKMSTLNKDLLTLLLNSNGKNVTKEMRDAAKVLLAK